MRKVAAGVWSGAILGVALAATATVARRLTWTPYAPVHLASDLLVCMAAGALLLGLLRRPLPARARLALLAPSTIAIALCALVRPACPVDVPPLPATAPPMGGGGARSVLLIVLDTARRASLSLHGYARPTTPCLDEWAKGALVFDQATSTSSWTLPAHASMFTGLYARSHGAHGYKSERDRESTYRLPDSCDTLAEIASRGGVATAAIVANFMYLDPRFGTAQGFASYFVAPPRSGFRLPPSEWLARKLDPVGTSEVDWLYVRDAFVTDWTIETLEALRGRPFFVFVNYFDAHRPNLREPTPEVPLEDEIDIPHFFPVLQSVMRGAPIDERIRRSLVNAYDRELQHLDRELGRLFAWLEASGLARETLVIVTSDHGEHFGEHGLVDHGALLYDEVVDVPLLVKGPGVVPGRSARPVQVLDVFPTALEALGLPPAPCQGTSLLGTQDHPIVSEWYAAANGFLLRREYKGRFEHDWRSIRHGDWRLLVESRGHVELYDLAADPRETRDLARERPDVVADLSARLAAWVALHPRGENIPVEESVSRHAVIHALGYAGDEPPRR